MNIGSFVITVEYTLQDADELINMLNQPLAVPTVTWAKHIDIWQRQVAPQANEMKANLEKVKTATEKTDER
jgi:hypothetical protein